MVSSHFPIFRASNYVFTFISLPIHKLPQSPDWLRLSILFLWYISGIPTAYIMHVPCSTGAPGVWARAGRVFIEGVVAFGLAGLIHVGIFRIWWRV